MVKLIVQLFNLHMNNILNFFNPQKIKMLIVLVLSFLVVKYASPQIFMANTPVINPSFVTNIKNTPSYIASIPQKIGNIFIKSPQSEMERIAIKNVPPGLIFQPLTKGVEAQVAEDPTTGKKYLNIPAGTEYKFEEIEVNGKMVKVIRIIKN